MSNMVEVANPKVADLIEESIRNQSANGESLLESIPEGKQEEIPASSELSQVETEICEEPWENFEPNEDYFYESEDYPLPTEMEYSAKYLDKWDSNPKRMKEELRRKKIDKHEKINDHYVRSYNHHKKLAQDSFLSKYFDQIKSARSCKRPNVYVPTPTYTNTSQSTTERVSKNSYKGGKTKTKEPHPPRNERSHNHPRSYQTEDEMRRVLNAEAQQFAAALGISVQQYVDMQTRDLTPEDYELLLTLDSKLKPKTVSNNLVDSFPTKKIEKVEDVHQCMVCLMELEIGDIVKVLPKCGHSFHPDCISQWLTKSSVNCPIDGLPVEIK